ncbi:hypothetical protein BGZ93_007273 [Podila epicladia]|nr:hypothetical protein BGZ92_007837 [Podila epicladia]KAG0099515.1 hypothetical protein BGZ93_007273 [Podila epicladia]
MDEVALIQIHGSTPHSSELQTGVVSMSYNDMEKLVHHLQKLVTIKIEGYGRRLIVLAYMSTAITLRLTFDEVLQLRGKHISYQTSGVSNSQSIPAIKVSTPFYTSDPTDPTKGNMYEICRKPDSDDHTCFVRTMTCWITWLGMQTHRPVIGTEDFLFPYIFRDDQVDINRSFSMTELSRLMHIYANDAGLLMNQHQQSLLDHDYFPHGGSKHQFLHAQDPLPPKEFQQKSQELDFNHAVTLSKIEYEAQEREFRHAAELYRIKQENLQVRQQYQELRKKLDQLHRDIHEVNQDGEGPLHLEAPDPEDINTLQLENTQQAISSHDPEGAHHSRAEHPTEETENSLNHQHSVNDEPFHHAPHQGIFFEDSLHGQELDDEPLLEDSTDGPNPVELLPPLQSPSESDGGDIIIPKIWRWKEAIRQWDEGDPEQGLIIPLKDWSSVMRSRNRNFRKRRVIVEEFEFFGRDEEKLQKYYGENTKGVDRLILAIGKRRKKEHRQFDELDLKKRGRQVEANMSGHGGVTSTKEEGMDELLQGDSDDETDVDSECRDKVVQCIPRIKHWKEAILQWDRGDPKKGLIIPLSKWKYSMRRRHQDTFYPRRTIAKEFEHFGRNEGKMRVVYGDDMSGSVKNLVLAIRRRYKKLKKRCSDETDLENDEDYEDGGDKEEDDEEEEDGDDEEEDEEERLVKKQKVSSAISLPSSFKVRAIPMRVQPPRRAK